MALLYLVLCQWLSFRVSRRSPLATDIGVVSGFEAEKERIAAPANTELRLSNEVGPACGGVLKRIVFLPVEAVSWQAKTLRMVLVHELSHVKRQDPAASLVGHVACALHWFNPLAWLLLRRMREESERCCDELVLASGVDAADYATELVDIARSMQRARPIAALSQMAHASQIERRLGEILMHKTRLGKSSRLARLTLVVAALAFTLPLMGARLAGTLPPDGTKPWEWKRSDEKVVLHTNNKGQVTAIDGVHPSAISVDKIGIVIACKPAVNTITILPPKYTGKGVKYHAKELDGLDPHAVRLVIDNTGQMRQVNGAEANTPGGPGMEVVVTGPVDQAYMDLGLSPGASRIRLILTEKGALAAFKKLLKEQQDLAKK